MSPTKFFIASPVASHTCTEEKISTNFTINELLYFANRKTEERSLFKRLSYYAGYGNKTIY